MPTRLLKANTGIVLPDRPLQLDPSEHRKLVLVEEN